jgi:hypothetical protein
VFILRQALIHAPVDSVYIVLGRHPIPPRTVP